MQQSIYTPQTHLTNTIPRHNTTNAQYDKQYNNNQTNTRTNATIHLHTPNTFNEHNTTTQYRKRPIRQKALKGRYSCIAQGGMRAKPDMKPWVYTQTKAD